MKTTQFQTKNFLFSAVTTVFIGASANAQTFNDVINEPGIDHNHYSIEAYSGNQLVNHFAVAGTRFNPNGTTDMHVGVIDVSSGSAVWLWSEIIDISEDDRALDVTINPFTLEVVVTGYTTVNNVQKIYASLFDGFTGFQVISQTYDDSWNRAGAGTNVIYSQCTGNYILGGFLAQTFDVPLQVNNEAIIMMLDAVLSPITSVSVIQGGKETAINDILEITNSCEFFVTGSVYDNNSSQAVLAAKFDGNLNFVNNTSFKSDPNGYQGNHHGASAYYDSVSDEIYLLSNCANVRNPQLTRISNASGTPTITEHATLNMDPLGNHLPSGFYIDIAPANIAGYVGSSPDDLITMAGLHRTGWATPNGPNVTPDATMWMVTIYKNQPFAFAEGSVRSVSSNNFAFHGGVAPNNDPVFSTYTGTQPYIFTQEIGTVDDYSGDMTFIAAIDTQFPSNYSVDIFRTNTYGYGNSCFEPLLFDVVPESFSNINIDYTITDMAPYTAPNSYPHFPALTNYCTPAFIAGNNNQTQQAGKDGSPQGIGSNLGSGALSSDLAMTVQPNPFTDNLTINFDGAFTSGSVKIVNIIGEVVYEKDITVGAENLIVDTRDFKGGMYVVSYSNDKFQKSQKMIKL